MIDCVVTVFGDTRVTAFLQLGGEGLEQLTPRTHMLSVAKYGWVWLTMPGLANLIR